jgi:hypothetical protein
MCYLVQKLIEANGVAGLQARQPSPHFQRLKAFAEDFVFDGSAGEDDGAGLFFMIISSKILMNALLLDHLTN